MPQKIFLNSIPKAGAHLAERVLAHLGFYRGHRSIGSATLFGRRVVQKMVLRRPLLTSDVVTIGIELATPIRASWVRRRLDHVGEGQYLRGHVAHTEYFEHLLQERGFRLLHIVRDPRDVVVSHAHYILSRPRHPLYRHYRSLPDWSARLAFSITGGAVPGTGYLTSIAARYRSMEPWERYPGALTVHFEDLVGALGGGTLEAQQRALIRVCALAEVEASADLVDAFPEVLGVQTSTFRRGHIGGWREAFGAREEALFHEVAGDLLERWGYAERRPEPARGAAR